MGKPSPHIPCRNHYFNISLISIVHKNIGNTCMISGTFVNVLFSLFLCCYQMFATSRLTHTQERGRFQTSHKTPNGCPINMEWTCKLVLLLPMLRESYTMDPDPWTWLLIPDPDPGTWTLNLTLKYSSLTPRRESISLLPIWEPARGREFYLLPAECKHGWRYNVFYESLFFCCNSLEHLQ